MTNVVPFKPWPPFDFETYLCLAQVLFAAAHRFWAYSLSDEQTQALFDAIRADLGVSDSDIARVLERNAQGLERLACVSRILAEVVREHAGFPVSEAELVVPPFESWVSNLALSFSLVELEDILSRAGLSLEDDFY